MHLQEHGEEFKVARLEVGDFHVVCNNDTVVCIEHKRASDLVQSIKSGRIIEQCRKMLDTYEHPRLMISGVIVKTPKSGPCSVSPVTGYQSTEFYNSMDARWMVGTLATLQAAGIIIDHWPLSGHIGEYLLHIKTYYEKEGHDSLQARPRNVTIAKSGGVENAIIAMGINGVGEKLANVLCKHYHNIHNLVNASVQDHVQLPGVGPTTAKAIYEFFRSPPTEPADTGGV